ncbi:protein-tyrosine phosphatase family protein [Synechococcus elongatus]|uniref:Dual specificity protein phosphatase n=2 Tax=Synechococcus elongatus TaxID=32046 RepID=Q31S74_SYNE7|nr:dual specificity protein phosphatase [Synechococcus elongatus]MBD2688995.1 dual specificity protein phosphatase family protein [Synechococcus elongatus FACHB-1061]ABB56095.1 dual specificity protein phosphatase [Synechococcus elongatus PCC 7942 = FACHB-805]AJD56846.1 protein phosphatase [Synechococcus elongatus UTEX 2973]MBD2587927.1 dual specificity protein phosphatase family protein [Synechococcus elongatus FACHB-242]MBD2707365.1 dual specificity protein phosphatase family protein [Synech
MIPGRLAIGPLPHEQQRSQFEQENIQAVLSLCAPQEGPIPEWIQIRQWQRCILPDSYCNKLISVEQITTAVEQLHQLILTSPPVYIHCIASIERSPLITLAYLCRHRGLEFWEALSYLQQVHRATRPTDTQIRVLQQYLRRGSDQA